MRRKMSNDAHCMKSALENHRKCLEEKSVVGGQQLHGNNEKDYLNYFEQNPLKGQRQIPKIMLLSAERNPSIPKQFMHS